MAMRIVVKKDVTGYRVEFERDGTSVFSREGLSDHEAMFLCTGAQNMHIALTGTLPEVFGGVPVSWAGVPSS